MRFLTLVGLVGLFAFGAVSALSAGGVEGRYHVCRQYYSGWQKHADYSYYYRTYYYKPTPDYVGYKHHYVIYYPRSPKYLYFYNPYKKVYWGRCPTNTNGQARYSLLAEADRKGTLEQIPESAFPPPRGLPAIPESADGAKMDLPPDDLPKDEFPPK